MLMVNFIGYVPQGAVTLGQGPISLGARLEKPPSGDVVVTAGAFEGQRDEANQRAQTSIVTAASALGDIAGAYPQIGRNRCGCLCAAGLLPKPSNFTSTACPLQSIRHRLLNVAAGAVFAGTFSLRHGLQHGRLLGQYGQATRCGGGPELDRLIWKPRPACR
jgi:hypothetical protein